MGEWEVEDVAGNSRRFWLQFHADVNRKPLSKLWRSYLYESSASQSSSRTLNFRWYRLHISLSSELSITQLSSYEKLWEKRRTPSKSLSNNEKTFLLSRLFPLKLHCSSKNKLRNFDGNMFVYVVRLTIVPISAENLHYRSRCWERSSGQLCRFDHREPWATHCPGQRWFHCSTPMLTSNYIRAQSERTVNEINKQMKAPLDGRGESTYLVHVWSKGSHQTRDNLKGSLEREVLEYAAVQLIQFALGSSL